MAKAYHCGRYRGCEWGKHIRPFLKRTGNKRWRLDGQRQIEQELHENAGSVAGKQILKKKKKVLVKITTQSTGGFKYSYYRNYGSLKKAEAVIARYAVIRTTIFERKGKILKSYEKHHTK